MHFAYYSDSLSSIHMNAYEISTGLKSIMYLGLLLGGLSMCILAIWA